MSSKVFVLNQKAFGKVVLKNETLREILEREADNRKARAGEGYETESKIGNTRALAMVYPETPEAKRDNSENNTLLRVMK